MIAKPAAIPADLRRRRPTATPATIVDEQQRPQAVDQRAAGVQLGQQRLRARRRQQPRDRRRGLRARARAQMPISAASAHQAAHTYDGGVVRRVPAEPDHRQRREQRRRRRAQQDRGLEEVAEPQRSEQERAQQAADAVGAVDHRVGLLLQRRRALVRAHADAQRVAEPAPSPAARSGRGTRRGRSRRRPRRRRRRGRCRAAAPTIPAPLSIRTGGRISSTLRPQWATKPAFSAASATSSIGGQRVLLVRHAAPVQARRSPPCPPAARAGGAASRRRRRGRSACTRRVQACSSRSSSGAIDAGAQHLGAVRAEVGDRARARRSGARPMPAGRTRRRPSP